MRSRVTRSSSALVCAALALALGGCTILSDLARGPHAYPIPSEAELTQGSIGLTRGECYGTSPVYTVVVHGDGRVEWDGMKYVDAMGKHTFTVDPATARALIKDLSTGAFVTLDDRYEQQVEDIDSKSVSVTAGPVHKEVSVYSLQPPKAFTDAAKRIDGLVGADALVGGPHDPDKP